MIFNADDVAGQVEGQRPGCAAVENLAELFELPDRLEPFRGAWPGQTLDPILPGAGKNKLLGRQQERRARPGSQYGVDPFQTQASDHGADNWSIGRYFAIQGGGKVQGSQTSCGADGRIDILLALHGNLEIGAELDVHSGEGYSNRVPRGFDYPIRVH